MGYGGTCGWVTAKYGSMEVRIEKKCYIGKEHRIKHKTKLTAKQNNKII